jgi:hypothetical protein
VDATKSLSETPLMRDNQAGIQAVFGVHNRDFGCGTNIHAGELTLPGTTHRMAYMQLICICIFEVFGFFLKKHFEFIMKSGPILVDNGSGSSFSDRTRANFPSVTSSTSFFF